jgi:tripartite-type tricarboxylate transporter receptor subunit TctC
VKQGFVNTAGLGRLQYLEGRKGPALLHSNGASAFRFEDMLRIAAVTLASLLLGLAQPAAAAQPDAYPVRPIRLVIANTPGAAPDTVGRLVAAGLTELWGQQVVVDNRPGATGLIAAETVARAAPDGYTLWLPTMTQLIATLQAQRLMLAKDFTPVSLVGSTPFVIVVGSQVPVNSMAEWIAYAKARPGKLGYGSSGQWGSSHFCMHSIGELAGLDVLHVPYKGTSLVLNDLAGGRIQIYCTAAPSLPALTQSGRVKMLAISYLKPSKLVPGVPPVADTLRGFEMLGWYGMQAPAGTPKRVVDAIYAGLSKVLSSPELGEKLHSVGANPVGMPPQEFATFLHKETERWQKLLREGGVVGAKGAQ